MRAPADDFDPREFDDDEPRVQLGAFEPLPAARAPLALPPRLAVGNCRDCPSVGVALHPRTGGRDRIVCGDCAGKSNRRTVETTRDVIRALKAAAVGGDSAAQHDLLAQLGDLVGPHQAGETMRGIRDRIAQPATATKARRS